MSRQEEWTRESEAEALERLRVAPQPGPGVPILLIYSRQSVSDFDAEGRPRGPSLDQQLDAVTRRGELQELPFEHFQDADRSGKETSRRPRLPGTDGEDPDRARRVDRRGRLLRR